MRFWPRATSVTVTVAPEIAPPVWSVIWPEMRPVFNWALSEEANANGATMIASTKANFLMFGHTTKSFRFIIPP